MFVTRGCFNPELLSRCAVSDTECSPLSPTLPRPPWSLPEVLDRAEPQSNPSPGSPPQSPPPRIQPKIFNSPPPHPPPSTAPSIRQENGTPRDPQVHRPTKPKTQKKASLMPWPGAHATPDRQTTQFPKQKQFRTQLIGPLEVSVDHEGERASCNMHLPCTESGAGELSMG